MKVLVIGGGAQGSAAAFDLVRHPEVGRVVMADRAVDRPASFLEPFLRGSGGAGPRLELRALDGAAPCRRIVASERVYLVPRPDDRLIVGATVEEQGFDTTVTAGGVHELLREAYRVLPEVAEMELVEASAGLRPGTADNLPLVGPSPVDGLLWATGHYRNGILLAPLAADTIVDRLFRSHFYPHSDEKCERNAERVLR